MPSNNHFQTTSQNPKSSTRKAVVNGSPCWIGQGLMSECSDWRRFEWCSPHTPVTTCNTKLWHANELLYSHLLNVQHRCHKSSHQSLLRFSPREWGALKAPKTYRGMPQPLGGNYLRGIATRLFADANLNCQVVLFWQASCGHSWHILPIYGWFWWFSCR